MDNIWIVLLVLLGLIALGIFIGKMIKGDRTDEEQEAEDNDQAAFLAAIDKPHSRVDDFTSPVTGKYTRKASGSVRVPSSTPDLAGAGPIVKKVTPRSDLAAGGMTGGVLGYGLGYDNDFDGVPNSVDPVDLNDDDNVSNYTEPESTVTEPAHVVEDAPVVYEAPATTYEPPSYSPPVYEAPSYSAPSYDPPSSDPSY